MYIDKKGQLYIGRESEGGDHARWKHRLAVADAIDAERLTAALTVLDRVSSADDSGSSAPDAPPLSPSKAFARPKSSTLALPSGVMRMLAGFRSRWITP